MKFEVQVESQINNQIKELAQLWQFNYIKCELTPKIVVHTNTHEESRQPFKLILALRLSLCMTSNWPRRDDIKSQHIYTYCSSIYGKMLVNN